MGGDPQRLIDLNISLYSVLYTLYSKLSTKYFLTLPSILPRML